MSTPETTVATFGTYLVDSISIAALLLPVLAWYEVFRDWSRTLMSEPDTLTSKIIQAVILTAIVFVIIMLINRARAPKPAPEIVA